MATKANSKPCETSGMELFPRSRYWAQGQTQNLAEHLRWSFIQKQSKAKSRSLFVQKPPSWMFGKAVNMLLHWLPKLKMFHF